jgi:hypothetical protein
MYSHPLQITGKACGQGKKYQNKSSRYKTLPVALNWSWISFPCCSFSPRLGYRGTSCTYFGGGAERKVFYEIEQCSNMTATTVGRGFTVAQCFFDVSHLVKCDLEKDSPNLRIVLSIVSRSVSKRCVLSKLSATKRFVACKETIGEYPLSKFCCLRLGRAVA